MNNRCLPNWRSLMFCPANVQRFVDRAHARGADGIILDLEDSVGACEKDAARANVRSAALKAGQAGADVLVRINRELPLAVADISAAIGPAVMGLVLPKIIGPEHVRLLSEVVTEREVALGLPYRHTCFVALVESAAGIEHLNAIARSDERLVAMAVGGEDLATDLDAEPSIDSLYVAKVMGLYAARAADILPLGVLASVANTSDNHDYLTMLKRSRALGFACATCVHPTQVPLLNQVFGPTSKQVEHAQRVVGAYEDGLIRGVGAVSFEGSMVDRPVVERARRLIARAHSFHSDCP